MKQIIIVCILLNAAFQTAVAQHSLGLKAGVNLADQRKNAGESFLPATYQEETRSLMGYQIGVFYKTSLGKAWRLSIEPALSQIGSRNYYLVESNLNEPSKQYYKDKVSYIDIPVTLQYSLKSFYVGAGPGIALRVGSRWTEFENRSFKTDYYKTFDASANFLAGYAFCEKLDANFRYSYGLLNVRDKDRFLETKNQFASFSILYTIGNKSSAD
jgi:hypothetical protein